MKQAETDPIPYTGVVAGQKEGINQQSFYQINNFIISDLPKQA